MRKKSLCICIFAAVLILLTSCSGTAKDNRTIDTFKTAFEDGGIVIENEDVPYYQMIGAKDGWLFYDEGHVVKIYEFEDEAALKESMEAYSFNFETNGKFALETSGSEAAIEIFNGVEK